MLTEWHLGHHGRSSGCVCEGIVVGFGGCIEEFRFFTLSIEELWNYGRFLRYGIILSAVENIYWRRRRLGSGGGIKREETMNPERCGVAFSDREN